MGQEQQDMPDHGAETATSVLHRKVASGQAEHSARAMSLTKALRLAVARVADTHFDMAMAALRVHAADVEGANMSQQVREGALLILMDGRHGRRAGAMLDLALVTGLIQQQTMGQVLQGGVDVERPMTQTDAAICAPFLNAVVEQAAGLPDDAADRDLIAGYTFGARAEDPRQLSLALDAQDYLMVDMSVDIAGGMQQGQIVLFLPRTDAGALTDDLATANMGKDGGETPALGPSPKLDQTVLALHAELRVSLAHLKLSLRQFGAMRVGDEISLPDCDFNKAAVESRDGKKLATCTLGQLDGKRAVQVNQAERREEMPRRRAADRAELDLPRLDAGRDAAAAAPASVMMDENLPELAELPEFAPGQDMPPLPELPDMSDLPDLDDLDMVTDARVAEAS